MAVRYTWFLADDAEFAVALCGWKPPRPPDRAPIRKRGRNPFTGGSLVVWDYGELKVPNSDPRATFPDYDHLPHFVSKIDLFDFSALIHVLTGADPAKTAGLLLASELAGPSDNEYGAHAIPDHLTAALAAEPVANVRAVATDWAVTSQRPGIRRFIKRIAGPSPDDIDHYSRWFSQLHHLATTALSTNRQMFVLWTV